ncbi:MAG: TlpA disulfide reductase family protein, partial [Planctomycetota bacterium]
MPAIEIDRPILSHKSFNNIGLQLGLCLILTGCTPTPPAVAPTTAPVTVASKDKTETTSKLASTPDVTQAEKPKTTGQVELQVVDLKGYETILARHAGQVVLVDFWATWCAPCRKQFPHSVQLHRKLQDRGLAVISVSIDQLEEGESL